MAARLSGDSSLNSWMDCRICSCAVRRATTVVMTMARKLAPSSAHSTPPVLAWECAHHCTYHYCIKCIAAIHDSMYSKYTFIKSIVPLTCTVAARGVL